MLCFNLTSLQRVARNIDSYRTIKKSFYTYFHFIIKARIHKILSDHDSLFDMVVCCWRFITTMVL